MILTLKNYLLKTWKQYKVMKENCALKKKLQADFFNHYFVGKHPKFLETIERITKVAETESNVLICGEGGTGKELAARAIHLHSNRSEGPFITVDCTTLTREMTEAAPAKKDDAPQSVFEAANGGTIYLERVEELDSAMQARVIRILQDSKVPRGNEWEWVPIDVRFIASTSIDLFSAMAQGRFRENLYYCLSVVNVSIPPLRERREDIGILCDHFFREIAEKNAKPVPILHKDTLAKLMEYDWPGNVRQLRNVMERIVSLSENRELSINDLPDEIRYRSSSDNLSYKEARQTWLQKFERHYLQTLLHNAKGNISRASEVAGIARMSLYRMLKRTGLQQLVTHERTADRNGAVAQDEQK